MSGQTTVKTTGREQELDCSRPMGDLKCDFGGAEPIDLALNLACRTPGVALVRGRIIALKLERRTPNQILVQWLDGTEFPALKVVAEREVSPNLPVQIVVGSTRQRLVRFIQPRASPVTITAAELLKDSTLDLQDIRPGGELLGRIQDAPVLPDFYRFGNLPRILASDDPRGPSLQIRNSFVRAVSLPAGSHSIVPVYAGGMLGRPVPFVIGAGQSTAVDLRPERVGRVDIVADSATCLQAESLRIVRKVVPLAGTIAGATEVFRGNIGPDCRLSVAGLTPGDYDAVFGSAGGSLLRRAFIVAEQDITKLSVSTVEVNVRGRITNNDRPFTGAVEFVAIKSGSTMRASTDGAGAFDVTLADTGDFDVFLRSGRARVIGQQRRTHFVPGDNSFDWSITGGEVRIQVTGWDRSVPLDLFLRRAAPISDGSTAESIRIRVEDELPLAITGLGLGEYTLEGRETARQRNRAKISRNVRFVLDDRNATAEVKLDLIDNTATMTVIDEAGLVVPDALAYSTTGMARSLGGGVLSLEDISPGAPVQVRASGLTPSCVIPRVDGETVVRLERGRAVEVRLQGLPNSIVPVGSVTWSGVGCAVGMEDFEYGLLAPIEGVSRFLIRNFPSANNVVFTVALPAMKLSLRDQLQVQQDGVLWIKIR
jgi:hypothetical protein